MGELGVFNLDPTPSGYSLGQYQMPQYPKRVFFKDTKIFYCLKRLLAAKTKKTKIRQKTVGGQIPPGQDRVKGLGARRLGPGVSSVTQGLSNPPSRLGLLIEAY